jgi:hypothetical protein
MWPEVSEELSASIIRVREDSHLQIEDKITVHFLPYLSITQMSFNVNGLVIDIFNSISFTFVRLLTV